MTAAPLAQVEMFAQLCAAAEEAGLHLVAGYAEQGGYWLSHGIHTFWLPDLKAVNRALVTGCWLHEVCPKTLRLVVVPEPPAVPANPAPKISPWVREMVARNKAVLASDERAAANGNEWWRKDPTPQNMRKRVQR